MAIDWSGYDTFGKGIAQGIGSFADLAGLSGKAQSLAQLRATLNGQEAPQTPFQKLGDLLKSAVGGKGLDGRGVAQQTLGSLTAPQTPATVPAGPGASLSPQDMDTLTQRYGGGTAPVGAVTSAPLPPAGGNGLPTAANAGLRNQGIDPNKFVPPGTQTFDSTYKAAVGDPNALAGGGFSDAYYKRLVGIESGGNSKAVNKDSGAAGPAQFIPSTAKQYGLTDPTDPAQAYAATQRLTADNAAVLRKNLGRDPTPGELYLAHQQGGQGASDLLLNPNAPAASIVGVKAVVQNGGTAGMTAGQFANKWISRFEGGGGGTQVASAGAAPDATGAIPAASPAAAQQGFGANIPTEALVNLLTNQYLPAEDKNIVMALLQTRMPQAKQFGFQIGPDGTMYRTNATTGEATAVGSGGVKPTNDQQEYAAAKAQGYQGSFMDYKAATKTGTTVNVGASESELGKQLGGALGKNFAGMIEDGNTAKTDLANIGVLRDALAQAPTGLAGGIQSVAQDWGINIGKNADAVQVVKSVLARLTPAQRVPGSGTTSDRDLEMFKGALPKLTGTPEGNALILDTMQAMAEFKQAQADIASRLAAGDFTTDTDKTGQRAALAALRALPDPMAAFKAKGRDVIAGKGYQSGNAAPGGQQPVPVKTPEEAAKLPSGTPILLPDGTTGVVP